MAVLATLIMVCGLLLVVGMPLFFALRRLYTACVKQEQAEYIERAEREAALDELGDDAQTVDTAHP